MWLKQGQVGSCFEFCWIGKLISIDFSKRVLKGNCAAYDSLESGSASYGLVAKGQQGSYNKISVQKFRAVIPVRTLIFGCYRWLWFEFRSTDSHQQTGKLQGFGLAMVADRTGRKIWTLIKWQLPSLGLGAILRKSVRLFHHELLPLHLKASERLAAIGMVWGMVVVG